jgi:hypothetical protein
LKKFEKLNIFYKLVYEPAAKSDGVPSLKCVAWPGKKTAVKGWSLGGCEAEAPYDA